MAGDLTSAWRSIRRAPLTSAAIVASLALGIGASASVFSLMNGLVLRPVPVPHPERLVTITSDSARRMGFLSGLGWNVPMWSRLRDHAGEFGGETVFHDLHLDLASSGERQIVSGVLTSGSFFDTVGVGAQAGRTYGPADDRRGGGPEGPVAVISDAFWARRWSRSTGAVGSTLRIEDVPFTIVGVTPREFTGIEVGRGFDVAIPLGDEVLFHGSAALTESPRALLLIPIIRLKPQQTIASATATLRRLQDEIIGTGVPQFLREPFVLESAGTGADPGPRGLRQQYVRTISTVLGISLAILLICCTNVGNLQIGRTAARLQEFAIRRALGASAWQVARMPLAETLLLTGAGGLAGLAAASTGARLVLNRVTETAAGATVTVSPDWRVLLFTTALTAVTAGICGVAPAWRAARSGTTSLLSSRPSSRNLKPRLSSALVVIQVALSLTLVVMTTLLLSTLYRLTNVPLGFDAARVLLVEAEPDRAHASADNSSLFDERLERAVTSVAGVERVASSFGTPANLGMFRSIASADDPGGKPILVLFNVVSPGWFATYGTPILRGRDFAVSDAAGAPPVTIVNDALARRFLPGGPAVGRVLEGRTIVGVAGNQLVLSGYNPDGGTARSLRDSAPPAMYVPVTQSGGLDLPPRAPIHRFSVRTSDDASLLPGAVSAAIARADPTARFSVRPLAGDVRTGVGRERLVGSLAALFSGLALALAGLGLFGLTHYSVAIRRPEIGVRLALGAAPRDVARLVAGRTFRLTAMGIGVGLALSLWIAKFVAPLLYDVTPRDPGALAIGTITLAAVAGIATWQPAAGAARSAPADVLREG